MEYLVQVLTKSLADCSNDDILSWYDDNQTFVNKRNELLLGPWRTIISKGEGLIAIAGSNENKYGRCSYLFVISRYALCVCVCVAAAALTEFSPERKKKQETPRKQESRKKQASVKKMLRTRPAKYHYLIPPNTPEAARHELEQRQRPVRLPFLLRFYRPYELLTGSVRCDLDLPNQLRTFALDQRMADRSQIVLRRKAKAIVEENRL